MVHARGTPPNTAAGFRISPGQAGYVGMTKRSLSRLHAPYEDNCEDEAVDSHVRHMTSASCSRVRIFEQVRPPSSPHVSVFLPRFRLYEVVSLHMCILPYKHRKISEILLKLQVLQKCKCYDHYLERFVAHTHGSFASEVWPFLSRHICIFTLFFSLSLSLKGRIILNKK